MFINTRNKLIKVIISEKKDGSMRIDNYQKSFGFNKTKTKTKNQINWEKFILKNDLTRNKIIRAKLENGNKVVFCSGNDTRSIIEADGLVTNQKNLFLSITVADCLPILFFYFDQVLGLLHAGWRGLAEKIIERGINLACQKERINRREIKAIIGPSIEQKCYEVKDDLIKIFLGNYPDAFFEKEGRIFLDLKGIAKKQLMEVGLEEENIKISPFCTFCEKEKFFSFRREKLLKKKNNQGFEIEAMAVVAGILKK